MHKVMYPWRRIFKALFLHDRVHGQLYSLRQRDGRGFPVVVSRLGQRLRDSGADWHQWTKPLAGLLEVLEDEMPTLPTVDPQQVGSHFVHEANTFKVNLPKLPSIISDITTRAYWYVHAMCAGRRKG